MVLVDVDTWVTEYEACERLSHQIVTLLAERNQKKKLSEEYSRISANIRIRLKQFSTEVDQLNVKLALSSKDGSVTADEAERRQHQIEKLQSKFNQHQNSFKSVTPTERQALFTPSASELWEDDDEPPLLAPSSYSVQDLRQHQIQILENQNRGLDALSETLSRQKNLASRLGTEVEEQNEIIDGLSDNMERVDMRVNSATRQIGVVTRKDKTCGYWIVIVLLFIAICVVALV